MALRFFGKDGSFVFVGYPVNDPGTIAEIETLSHIDPGEQVFRVPRELRKAIWEACGGYDPDFG